MDDILAKSRNVPQTQQNIVHNNPLKKNSTIVVVLAI
jgi:hypothetical protein